MSTSMRRWRRSLFVVAASTLCVPGTLLAQDDGDDAVEEITVTGSKIKRDEFSSISPVQVIGGSESVKIGTVDVTQMIAESPFVFGTQLDGSTNAGSTTGAVEGVSASGPGSATVALRGLGPERTLLLINGRRLSPSGVRGAPVAPDLNLVPSAIVDRIEILTDGASSIYGADAVAGVANIILRSEFEGLELRGFGTATEHGGGEEGLFSIIGGAKSDNASFMVAAEYFDRQHIFARDRDNWNNCLRDIDVAPDGREYTQCLDSRPDNATFISSQGFVYYTPGATDIGIADWSTNAGAATYIGRTGQNALVGTAAETPYNLQQEELDTQMQGDIQRVNLYATGRYDFTPNHSAYIETSYSQRQNIDIFTSEQAFPAIPHQIPQLDANGNVIVDATGAPILVDNPLNPFDNERSLPVYSLQGLTQRRQTDIDNYRFVGGVTGDFGAGWFRDKGWSYDAYVNIEESSGTSIQAGMLESAIRESIDTLRVNADGELECGLERTAGGFGFITPRPCVVVNWFSPTLFDIGGGDKTFATQEEEDFLFGNVINTTTIEQRHYSALVTGELFDMSAGAAAMAFGLEYRENSIDSANDIVRAQGLSASEAPDVEGDTVGETWIRDVYGELELPLHRMLLVNLSGRYTDEKNFGSEPTWSAKIQFSPTEWFRLRGTAGTTFRAPNLREQFLAGQAGVIAGTTDPCVVPGEAVVGGVYDPNLEPRTDRVLNNCIQDGVDPTALGLQANVLVPTQTGGSEDIKAETSDSFTVGFVLEQPWTDAFNFDLGITYFDIEVNDTVEELDPATVLARCYNDEDNLQSPFCGRVARRGVNPENNTVSQVDASFVNLGLVTSKGYDINVRYLDDFSIGNTFFDIAATLTATHYAELLEQIDPEDPINDLVGEAGYPEWSWIFRIDLTAGNWGVIWRSRFIDEFARDEEDRTLSRNRTDGRDPCATLGGPVDPDGGRGPCFKKGFGDSVLYHDLSATYDRDAWSVSVGIRNLADEQPPLIVQSEGPARFNNVVQSGYDLYGRRYFMNLQYRF